MLVVNLLVTQDEKSGDHQSHWDSSSGNHELQSIRHLSRYFSLEQRGESTNIAKPRANPKSASVAKNSQHENLNLKRQHSVESTIIFFEYDQNVWNKLCLEVKDRRKIRGSEI